MRDEKLVPDTAYSAASIEDASDFAESSFSIGGLTYSLMYRTGAKPLGSTLPSVVCINKDEATIMDVAVGEADTVALTGLELGLSAVSPVGKFLALAVTGRDTTYTSVDQLAATAEQSVVWVKGGAYSRKFTVNAYPAVGSVVTVEYTTPASYYEGVLDTSDLLTSDPDYQKKVNDRVYAYQTAVNQHIASAASAIQPENVAEQLRLLLAAAGVSVVRTAAHLRLTGYINVTVDDSGDGNLIKAIAQEIETVADLSDLHTVGKVVRVTPRQTGQATSPSYYVVAESKTPGLTGFREVVWKETAGVKITPNVVFLLGAIVGNTLYIASTAALLETVSGLVDVPRFESSGAGDLDSHPKPEFLGAPITYLRPFQDRLMIVTGAIVFLSKSGDYFNFFNASALTVADDDPIEMFAEGSDGDVVSAGVQIDRSLLLFGMRQQYALPGREVITPHNAFIAVQSAHEDATVAPPTASGNLVFFAQQRTNRLTIQQMQTGAYADSFDAFDVSTQLDGYLRGTPRQIAALTSPSMLFIRTKEQPNGLFVYSYLDTAAEQQRLFDSWSRWEWDASLGVMVGITTHESTVYSLTLRDGANGVALVLDQFSREPQLADAPYIDSQRLWTAGGTIEQGWVGEANSVVAVGEDAGVYRLIGRELETAEVLFTSLPALESIALAGTLYDSSVEPTAPYIRDRKDKAVLAGRLVMTKYVVTMADSSALRAGTRGRTEAQELEVVGTDWVARALGEWALNTQAIAETYSLTIPIMREVRDFRLRLFSRNWLPMTISSVEWSGQFFTSRKE